MWRVCENDVCVKGGKSVTKEPEFDAQGHVSSLENNQGQLCSQRRDVLGRGEWKKKKKKKKKVEGGR